MPEPLRLLMVEDSPDDAALLEAELRAGGFAPEVHRVTSAAAFLEALDAQRWDLLLLDYRLPGFGAKQALRLLRERDGADLPVVVVSGTVGEAELVEMMKAGAGDYVQKQNLSRLVPAIRRELEDVAVRRQRREVLDRLRRSEAHLRALLDGSLDAIISMDARGLVRQWSRQAAVLFGWSEKEAVGQPLASLIVPPAQRAADWEGLRRYLTTGEARNLNRRVELTACRKDGREIPVEVTVVPLSDERDHFTAFVTDISDRKRAEMALRRSEEHFRTLIENASDLIALLDRDGQIRYESPAVDRILGYRTHERGADRSFFDLVHPEDAPRMLRLLDDLIRGQRVSDPARVRLRHRDGSWRTMEVVARRGMEEGGDVRVVINARDITERETLEAQLLQSQKIEAVGRLAGGVAHDFNNLVTAILGYSDLTLRRMGAQDPLRRNLEEITRAAERAAALTQQLLAFSRKQVLQPRVLDVGEVLERTQALLRRLIGEDIDLVVRAAPHVGRVRVDPVQLEQVLLNLAINARDAMPGGGRLVLEAEDADLDEAYAREHLGGRAGSFVMLAVSDTGHGMNRETLAHIFEPFFTTKEIGKGTGLGLSTVYGIVKQSGGYVWVYSEVGQGTTFKVYLPRVEERADQLAAAVSVAEPVRGSEIIMLVEDEDSVRELMQELLEAAGYRVLVASRPSDALRLADDFAGPVDLLLTDVVMPQMGGPELAQRLRGIRPGLKVVYLSGYSPGIVADRGVLDEGALFLQKPFSAEALETKVREALDGA